MTVSAVHAWQAAHLLTALLFLEASIHPILQVQRHNRGVRAGGPGLNMGDPARPNNIAAMHLSILYMLHALTQSLPWCVR